MPNSTIVFNNSEYIQSTIIRELVSEFLSNYINISYNNLVFADHIDFVINKWTDIWHFAVTTLWYTENTVPYVQGHAYTQEALKFPLICSATYLGLASHNQRSADVYL